MIFEGALEALSGGRLSVLSPTIRFGVEAWLAYAETKTGANARDILCIP